MSYLLSLISLIYFNFLFILYLFICLFLVGEMLECAKELAERGSHLTYGEFYNFASQIKRSHERR